MKVISAILKLGNINFIPTTNMDGTEGCAISNDYGKLSFQHDYKSGAKNVDYLQYYLLFNNINKYYQFTFRDLVHP